jgi:phage prohead protease, HK97 family
MPNKPNKQIRMFDAAGAPHILRAEDGSDTRTIEGYAIVFNQRSQLLCDWEVYRMVEEIIPPSAVSASMLAGCNIVADLEHDQSRMLARNNKGSGTLTLTLDDKGLMYRFDAPHTADGDYALEMVRRGDLFGSSFAYSTDEQVNVTYTKDGDTLVRNVNKIDAIYDVAIVANPAYLQTSVQARSAMKQLETVIKRSLDEAEDDNKEDNKPEVDTAMKEQLRNLRSLAK